MIDTVKAQFFGKFRRDVFKKASEQFDITYRAEKVCSPDEDYQANQRNNISISHRDSGLRFYGNEGGGTINCEVALPKLLWGRNDKVITTQAEVDKAWKSVEVDMIPEFFEDIVPIDGWSYCNFTRVDACWHVQEKPRLVVDLHRHARHPMVRKATEVYGNHAVVFPGVERRLRIYDKGLEQGTKANETCRVELQLRGGGLKKEFGLSESEYLTKLDGPESYRILRDHVMKFQRRMKMYQQDAFEAWKYTKCDSYSELVARTLVEDTRWANGERVYDTWARGKSRMQINRMQRRAHEYVQRFHIFSWADQLPEDPNQTTINFSKGGSDNEPEPQKSLRSPKAKA